MSCEGEVRSAHEYLQDSLTTAVNSYTCEQDEVSFTEMKGGDWKKKSSEETKSDSTVRDVKEKLDLKATDTSKSGKENSKLEISGVEKFPRQDVPCTVSNEPSKLTGESSEQKSEKTAKKKVHEPHQTCNTAAARYSRETLEQEIVAFTRDVSKLELTFPTKLNSQQRFDVHSIAEKLSLCHESRGEGKDRYIVVRKVKPASKGLFLLIPVYQVQFDDFIRKSK